ncbi:MAG: carbohydrate binding domain-containing protein [Victivallales bacterium]
MKMKKWIIFSASLLVSLNLSSKELLKDPSFEENSGKWPLPKGYRIERHAGRNGSAGLVYTRTNPKEYPLPQVMVKLEAGRTYEFKVWIRVENIKGDGASACLEYSSLTGKHLGGLYLKNVKDNDGKWHELSGIFTAPENAICKVTPYMRPGTTGTACFDDFSLLPKEDRYIVYATSDHNRIGSDGTLELMLFRNNKPIPAKEKIVCCLQIGDTVLRKPVRSNPILFSVPDAVPDKAKCRITLIETATDHIKYETELPLAHAAADSIPGGCEISSDGTAVIDGKRFMPLGFYCNVDEKNIALARSAGANTLLSYNIMWGKYGNTGGMEGIRKWLDLLKKNDMKVLFSIKHLYSDKDQWNGIHGGSAIVESAVKAFRNHPALLGWYICDEMPASMQDKLTARRRQVNLLDPCHPTFSVFFQFGELIGYSSGLDVIGVDPYPIRKSAPEKTDMVLVEYAMEQARKTGKPVWGVPQIFDYTVYENAGRAPTEQEMRSMSLLMAGLGAKGFIYYALQDLWSKKLPADHFDRQWPKVRSVVTEMKKLEPFIISSHPAVELPVHCKAGKVRAFQLTSEDGGKAILVCSIQAGPSKAVWKLSGSWHSLHGKTTFDGRNAEFAGNSIDSDVLLEK